MLYYLTSISLDIVGAVSWWVVSRATHGLYNGLYYIAFGSNDKKESIMMEPNETLKLLVQESIQQKEQITRLNENIIILSNYIKHLESPIEENNDNSIGVLIKK
jgi:hypothetical protein